MIDEEIGINSNKGEIQKSNLKTLDTWIKSYYSRIAEEKLFSLKRKDAFTNWALTALLVALIPYIELLQAQNTLLLRILILSGTICLLYHFFIHSCIAYGYLRKWRYIHRSIEKQWIQGMNKPEEIIKIIKTYDHTPRTTSTRGSIIKSQMQAGFLIVLGIPTVLLIIEIAMAYNVFFLSEQMENWMPIIVASIYVIYISATYIRYKYVSKPNSKEGE